MTTKMAPTRGIHFVFFFGFPLRSLGLFNLFSFPDLHTNSLARRK